MAVKLPERDRERLIKLGKTKKRTVRWLAKEAISQYLDREEKAELFRQETMARWKEYCRTIYRAILNWKGQCIFLTSSKG